MFGRITIKTKQADLLKEARLLATQHRCNALVSEHQAKRALLACHQSNELADHYESVASQLESVSP
jgi:hypothetical protein